MTSKQIKNAYIDAYLGKDAGNLLRLVMNLCKNEGELYELRCKYVKRMLGLSEAKQRKALEVLSFCDLISVHYYTNVREVALKFENLNKFYAELFNFALLLRTPYKYKLVLIDKSEL